MKSGVSPSQSLLSPLNEPMETSKRKNDQEKLIV